jgi:glycosyltransferase involved in cell wall biosynthesis
MKSKTITIGIAAYNTEDNIVGLLKSLLGQKLVSLRLGKIYVYCDSCTDNTARRAGSVKDKRITVIEGKIRGGFARSVKLLLGKMHSDINLLLNDDILISDTGFLEKLAKPFFERSRIGLVCGNPRPLEAKTLIEKAAISATAVYEKTLNHTGDVHNIFTCDGKILALAKDFSERLKFPADNNKLGNVDAYLYFSCISKGFLYRNVPGARVWFRLPSTLSDYVKLVCRDNANAEILEDQFGPVVPLSYHRPGGWLFYRNAFGEIFKNPLGCLLAMGVGVYGRFQAGRYRTWFSPTWEVNASSKVLNY